MSKLSKIKLDKKQRNLFIVFLVAVILLELTWASARVSKPSVTPTPEQEAVVLPEVSLAPSPATETLTSGDILEVQLVLEAADDTPTDGFDAQISFDPTVLELTDVRGSDFYSQNLLTEMDHEAGTVRIAAVNPPNQSEIKGGGILGTLVFKTLKAGETEINFGDCQVANLAGLNLLSQTTGGRYIIE